MFLMCGLYGLGFYQGTISLINQLKALIFHMRNNHEISNATPLHGSDALRIILWIGLAEASAGSCMTCKRYRLIVYCGMYSGDGQQHRRVNHVAAR